MSYTFRLTFSGLCAFVPNRDWDARVSPDKVTVLMLNTGSDSDKLNKLERFPDPHISLLRFELACFAPDLGARDSEAYGYWKLDKEDVTISFKYKHDGSDCASKVGDLSVVMDGTAKSFSHVPLMRRVCTGAGSVALDSLVAQPQGTLVAARFHLDKGILANDEFGKYRDKNVVVQFVPGPEDDKPYIGFLPHRVALEFPGLPEDIEVVLRASKFSDPAIYREIVLCPIDEPEGRRIVEVNAVNLCCGYVLGDKLPRESFPEADRDFECFYVLCEDFDDLREQLARFPIPVPIEHQNRREKVGGGDTIKCSMTRFDAPQV